MPAKWFEFTTRSQAPAHVLDEALNRAGERMVEGIRESWSPDSPSDPGEPPAVVSGELDSSVDFRVSGNRLYVGATADHASYLEEGTDDMEPRPFLAPAREAVGQVVRQMVSALRREQPERAAAAGALRGGVQEEQAATALRRGAGQWDRAALQTLRRLLR